MIQTLEYAPLTLTIRPGEKVLASHEHDDDEFLDGGLLSYARSAGAMLYIVVATDGEGSDRGDPEALKQGIRRVEGTEAYKLYGIPPENQFRLGLPDDPERLEQYRQTRVFAIRSLVARLGISKIFTTGHDGADGHPGHITAHETAMEAAGADIEVWGLNHDEPDVEIATDPAMKLLSLKPHKTQFDIDDSDPNYVPQAGTVEQPGIRLSPLTRYYLGRYAGNMSVERYTLYSPKASF